MYEYLATVLRVVDGDTVNVDVDLGLDISHRIKLRLYGINAPEMSTAEGILAKQHLIELLGTTNPVKILTVKDKVEKYGRYLATIIVAGVNLNQQMVTDGFAVVYLP